jgi:methionyl-tRNA formyltransferase
MLKVSIVVSNIEHPVYHFMKGWVDKQSHIDTEIVNSTKELRGFGDFLFLVSCTDIINQETRSRFNHCLVLHASDLPEGRGWSPHIWGIVNGNNMLTLSLLEAEDKVDSGRIWLKTNVYLDGSELFSEINNKLFTAEVELIQRAVNEYETIIPYEQYSDISLNYFPKRVPEDSRININDSILNQFNLLRVCDSERFPAFFELGGQRYTIKLEKAGSSNEKH